MIERVSVRNIGGIASAEMDFSGGLIVITGESGSGKSSLARAFEFASGRRAQGSLIRAGEDEASAEALWDAGGEQQVTRRTLSRSGKGRVFIGGAISTVGLLAELTSPLIEIQSQFAQLNLLDAARQLDMIDASGGEELAAVSERLASLFPMMLDAERETSDLRKRRAALEASLDGAPARVRLVKSLGLYDGCEAEWEAELAALERALADAGRHEELAAEMSSDDGDILEQLSALLRRLYDAAPDELRDEWSRIGEESLSGLQRLFDEARRELSLASREEIEDRLSAAEAKVGALRRVKRETGARSADELMEYMARVERDECWMSESADLIAAANAKCAELRAEIASLARRLRALREAASRDFAARVTANLADLAMEESRFGVELIKLDRVRANGADAVSFTLSAKDLPPMPVAKAASGGELSRILIAIQASIEPSRLPGSIIFDEVEAGLGGRAALLAAEKLRELADRCRVILITHEATIAARADQHFLVSRDGDRTSVREITGEEREREIARMLAGLVTPEALEHARSLLERR